MFFFNFCTYNDVYFQSVKLINKLTNRENVGIFTCDVGVYFYTSASQENVAVRVSTHVNATYLMAVGATAE